MHRPGASRTVDALNTLRAILVACAFVATVLLAFQGAWTPVVVLTLGIAAHLWLFVWLRGEKRKARDAAFERLLEG